MGKVAPLCQDWQQTLQQLNHPKQFFPRALTFLRCKSEPRVHSTAQLVLRPLLL